MKQVRIEPISPDTFDHAMSLVTESMDLEARRGERPDNFEEDWLLEYEKLTAYNTHYAGFVGYQNYNQVVGLSLISQARYEPQGIGVWHWFFVSPRSRVITLPLRLVRESLSEAKKRGLVEIISFVGADSTDQHRLQRALGAKPAEVEYRVRLEDVNEKVMRHVEGKSRASRREESPRPVGSGTEG